MFKNTSLEVHDQAYIYLPSGQVIRDGVLVVLRE